MRPYSVFLKPLIALLLSAGLVSLNSCNNSANYFQLTWQTVKTKTPFELKSHQGKWIVINFWATWCPPCLHEMPELQAFYDNSPDDQLIIVGISLDSKDTPKQRQKVIDFVTELGLTFPIVFSNDQEAKSGLGDLVGLPTNIILNPQGEIIYNQAGPINQARLAELTSNQLQP